jgi:hypothetical protein
MSSLRAKNSTLRKRYGYSKDADDRAAFDAQLRAIDANPGRLVPWEEVKARLGIETSRRG